MSSNFYSQCDPGLATVQPCQVPCSQCGLNLRGEIESSEEGTKGFTSEELARAETEERERKEFHGIGEHRKGVGMKELYVL